MSEPSERDRGVACCPRHGHFTPGRWGLEGCWMCHEEAEKVARAMPPQVLSAVVQAINSAREEGAERLREAEGLLREVEWISTDPHGIDLECPSCGGSKRHGHEPDCPLARWLAGVQGEVTEGIPSCPSCGHRGWECRRCADWIGAQP